jgi:hypothetical protein
MSLWLLIVLFGLIKVPLAGLMLWLPFRNDEAMRATVDESTGTSEDDGGSRTLPGGSHDPHPRRPFLGPPHVPTGGARRDPHGAPTPSSPPRVRAGSTRVKRVSGPAQRLRLR